MTSPRSRIARYCISQDDNSTDHNLYKKISLILFRTERPKSIPSLVARPRIGRIREYPIPSGADFITHCKRHICLRENIAITAVNLLRTFEVTFRYYFIAIKSNVSGDLGLQTVILPRRAVGAGCPRSFTKTILQTTELFLMIIQAYFFAWLDKLNLLFMITSNLALRTVFITVRFKVFLGKMPS